jgi:RNA polymerase sigma-70 factor (ECF subfamily)
MKSAIAWFGLTILAGSIAYAGESPRSPTTKPTELAIDDGTSAGKKSIAGSGHAVVFESPGDGATLTAVKIFGSRYGTPQPPAEDFHVWLCDADGKELKSFTFPYKLFLRGDPRWVTLKLPEPAALPKAGEKFIVCIGFNPQQTKGVYVHYDKHADGDCRSGLPGQMNDAFGQGDWMIRAVVVKKQ